MSNPDYNPIKGLFDQMREGVYVVARDSFELLYTNHELDKLYSKGRIPLGRRCFETLCASNVPCKNCTLLRSDHAALSIHNYVLNRDYEMSSYSIEWSGIPAYAVTCSDITDTLKLKRKQIAEATEIKNLVDSIPGGLAKYKIVPDGLKMLYCSLGMADMLGLTPQACMDEVEKDWAVRIFPADKVNVKKAIEQCAETGSVDITYRLFHADGSIIWTNAQGRLMQDDEHGLIIHAVYHSLSNITALYRELLDCTETLIHVSDFYTREIMYANRAAAEFAGKNVDEIIGKKCYEYMYGTDTPCSFCNLCVENDPEYHKDAVIRGRSFTMNARRITWNGHDAFIEYAKDITTARAFAKAEWETRIASFTAVDNALSGGTVINGMGLDAPLIYVSANIENLLGYTREEFQRMYTMQYADIIHPDDFVRVLALNKKYAEERPQNYEMEFRFIRKDKSVIWVLEKATFMEDFQGQPAYLSIFVNIAKQKQNEAALIERSAMFELLLENGNHSMWTYDIETRTAKLISSKKHRSPITSEGICNYPESVISCGYIKPSSAEELRTLMRRVNSGEKSASADIWCVSPEGEAWCDRLTYINIFDAEGEILRTVGIGEDVTEQRLAQQRYDEELAYQSSLKGENLLCSVRCNVSKGILESSYSAENRFQPQEGSIALKQGIDTLIQTGYTEEDRRLIKKMADQALLQKNIDNGSTELNFTYRRKMLDGSAAWVTSTIKRYRDIQTGDLKFFFYTVNIDREKINERIIETVASAEFDYIMFANLNTDKYYLYSGNVGGRFMPPQSGDNFAETVAELNRTAVSVEDSDRAVRDLIPAVIRENLKISPIFSGSYSSRADLPPQMFKKLQYFWLDEALGQLVITRSDVTDVVTEQQRQQSLLKDALNKAEQANHAKTEFLSRMSHDIRTPMNAILNLTELAADSIGDEGKLRSDLDKIKMSGDFLLGLINDILEMSRIESGRFTLTPKAYPVERFMSYLDSVMLPLFAAKNIHFTIRPSSLVPAIYVDEVRFNQIFFNILSNAAKYTPEGGSVTFDVNVLDHDEQHANVEFIIADNGIGMSEEFAKKAFDPFERESSVNAYTGTGLGLAITKAIVDALGGTIRLDSKQGVGTTVILSMDLPFPPKGSGSGVHNTETLSEGKQIDNLVSGRVLVAEDHPLNREVITRLLNKLGADVACVENGRQAVDVIRGAAPGDYRLVLMDVRMPVMDGITATKEIRALADTSMSAIPIIAMTADAFSDDRERCLEVGMNDFLAKPISLEELKKIIYTYMNQQ